MFFCGTHGCKDLCEFADIDVKETDKGVRVEISPKDASKAGSFKALIKACRELCHC